MLHIPRNIQSLLLEQPCYVCMEERGKPGTYWWGTVEKQDEQAYITAGTPYEDWLQTMTSQGILLFPFQIWKCSEQWLLGWLLSKSMDGLSKVIDGWIMLRKCSDCSLVFLFFCNLSSEDYLRFTDGMNHNCVFFSFYFTMTCFLFFFYCFCNREEMCDVCKGPLFGPGLRTIRPMSKLFSVKNVPLMFRACTPGCFQRFKNMTTEELRIMLYSGCNWSGLLMLLWNW